MTFVIVMDFHQIIVVMNDVKRHTYIHTYIIIIIIIIIIKLTCKVDDTKYKMAQGGPCGHA